MTKQTVRLVGPLPTLSQLLISSHQSYLLVSYLLACSLYVSSPEFSECRCYNGGLVIAFIEIPTSSVRLTASEHPTNWPSCNAIGEQGTLRKSRSNTKILRAVFEAHKFRIVLISTIMTYCMRSKTFRHPVLHTMQTL